MLLLQWGAESVIFLLHIIEYNFLIPIQVCDLKSFYKDLNNAILKTEKFIK